MTSKENLDIILKEMAEKKAAEDEADDDNDVEEKESFFGRFKHWLQS